MAILLKDPLLIASLVTITFAFVAWRIRGVTVSGAIAGGIICFVLILGAGLGAFAALVTVFLLAWISTRIGYRRKLQLGTAESRRGRKASQVFANLSIAAGCALLHATHPMLAGYRNEIFLLGMVAAFSEAASDTVSSELGQIQSSARLFTTWEKVPSGTDGGISLLGTFAGILAAALVSGICLGMRLISARGVTVAVSAATIGMLADSLIGALFERRKLLNNDTVNFLGTLSAALLAIFYASFFR